MKKLILISFLICSLLGNQVLFAQQREIDIDALIAAMSIEEKAGQMSQIDLGLIAEGGICALKNPQELNNQKLEEAIAKYHIGSILNVGCGSGTISLALWHSILNTIHSTNKKLSSNKVPILYGIDAIHGANYTKGATLFPQQIAQAATWNPELVKRGYEITAYETRATGIPWNFSPVLDLGRQPLWSRFFETFGEDVYLAKSMSKIAIEGLQGNDVNDPYHLAACMKHFLGYSMPLSGKDRTPAWISDRELREYFLPTFQTAINSGAKTVMINSGDINGTPVHANYDILTKLLRNELGFTGVAVTDWEDVYKLVNIHRVAKDKKEAVKMAIDAGIDMSMTPNDFEFTKLLIELVKEGSIAESRLDISVRRILQLKKELGLFEQTTFDKSLYPLFGSQKFAQASYDVAAESITLLKNEKNILPLKGTPKLLVCGAAANSLDLLNGAWTHTWLGVNEKNGTHVSSNKKTIMQALQDQLGKVNVLTNKGQGIDANENLEETLRLAQGADYIVVCLGETPATEIPGNINSLDLEGAQLELIEKLKTVSKPIILVACFNRPKIINKIVDKAEAILYAYLPSDEGGRAISDLIFGKINPSGKLPFTYPRYANSIVHYDHKVSEDQDIDFSVNAYRPQFDFGFGLSYTEFAYSNLSVTNNSLGNTNNITVKVNISNNGNREGMEVVQLYYNDLIASITPAGKKLVRFQKIKLAPGQSKEVKFILSKEDFSFINKELQRIIEPGEIELIINNLKVKINVE